MAVLRLDWPAAPVSKEPDAYPAEGLASQGSALLRHNLDRLRRVLVSGIEV